jgi:histidine triad (HIT) family protein
MSCVFCDIVSGKLPAEIVWRSDDAVAFLDSRPLFPGHVLLVPATHVATLADLPAEQVGPLFQTVVSAR